MNGDRQHPIAAFANTDWLKSTADFLIAGDQVHIWLASLDHPDPAEFETIISDDERVRANRFRFETDRRRFIIGRGILRNLLGGYLKREPDQINFFYSSNGKPSLDERSSSKLVFNLSHSDNLALYAFGLERAIGIDIERVNPAFVEPGTISLCLSKKEKEYYYSLSATKGTSYFFECWTRKESYLKALGHGLSMAPSQIESSQLQSGQFICQCLPTIDGFSSALVVDGPEPQLKFFVIPAGT